MNQQQLQQLYYLNQLIQQEQGKNSPNNSGQNYFKGYAKRNFNQSMKNLGQDLSGQDGAMGQIGNTLTNEQSPLLNTGTTSAATGAETLGTMGTDAAAAAGAETAGVAAVDPLTAVVMLAIDGQNRNRAKQAGQQLLNSTNRTSQNALQQTNQQAIQNNNNGIGINGNLNSGLTNVSNQSNIGNVSNAPINLTGALSNYSAPASQTGASGDVLTGAGDISNNIIGDYTGTTGGAAPVQNSGVDMMSLYQDYLRNNGYSDEVVNGFAQGLNSGDKNVESLLNLYNQSAGESTTPINRPVTDEEIAAARAGTFNTTPQTGEAVENQNINQDKKSGFVNGITDFSRGYQENRNNGFSPANLTSDKFTETTKGQDGQETTKTYDKSKMGRLGEAAGTIGRVLQNPTAQALVAGGISTALTGNPLYGVGMAQKYGSQRAMSNLYQDALAKNGVNVNPGTWGNLTSTDMNTLMTPTYKKQENDIKLAQQANTQAWREVQTELERQRLEAQLQKYDDDKKKAEAEEKRKAEKWEWEKNGKQTPNGTKTGVTKTVNKTVRKTGGTTSGTASGNGTNKQTVKDEYNKNLNTYRKLKASGVPIQTLQRLREEMFKQYGSSIGTVKVQSDLNKL